MKRPRVKQTLALQGGVKGKERAARPSVKRPCAREDRESGLVCSIIVSLPSDVTRACLAKRGKPMNRWATHTLVLMMHLLLAIPECVASRDAVSSPVASANHDLRLATKNVWGVGVEIRLKESCLSGGTGLCREGCAAGEVRKQLALAQGVGTRNSVRPVAHSLPGLGGLYECPCVPAAVRARFETAVIRRAMQY